MVKLLGCLEGKLIPNISSNLKTNQQHFGVWPTLQRVICWKPLVPGRSDSLWAHCHFITLALLKASCCNRGIIYTFCHCLSMLVLLRAGDWQLNSDNRRCFYTFFFCMCVPTSIEDQNLHYCCLGRKNPVCGDKHGNKLQRSLIVVAIMAI